MGWGRENLEFLEKKKTSWRPQSISCARDWDQTWVVLVRVQHNNQWANWTASSLTVDSLEMGYSRKRKWKIVLLKQIPSLPIQLSLVCFTGKICINACKLYNHVHFRITDQERKERLAEQAKSNEYHKFTEGNLILKQGLIDKRKVYNYLHIHNTS